MPTSHHRGPLVVIFSSSAAAFFVGSVTFSERNLEMSRVISLVIGIVKGVCRSKVSFLGMLAEVEAEQCDTYDKEEEGSTEGEALCTGRKAPFLNRT